MSKPAKWPLSPATTLISLGTCPVWSDSSLSAWRNIWSSATHWVHCKDADQTGQMTRLIWVFTGHTDHFVGFVVRQLKFYGCQNLSGFDSCFPLQPFLPSLVFTSSATQAHIKLLVTGIRPLFTSVMKQSDRFCSLLKWSQSKLKWVSCCL